MNKLHLIKTDLGRTILLQHQLNKSAKRNQRRFSAGKRYYLWCCLIYEFKR